MENTREAVKCARSVIVTVVKVGGKLVPPLIALLPVQLAGMVEMEVAGTGGMMVPPLFADPPEAWLRIVEYTVLV